MTLWTVSHQAPLSMRFSRQEYWSGLPFTTFIFTILSTFRTSLIAQLVKNSPAMPETLVLFLGQKDLLEKGQATHCSILGLPLWFSWLRICLQCRSPGFNPWVRKIPWKMERLPTPVFWPGEFHGHPRGRKESDTTE